MILGIDPGIVAGLSDEARAMLAKLLTVYDGHSAQNEKKQAVYYAKLFNLYKEFGDVIERVTFWGYRDDTSWVSESCPMPFTKNLEPKEALNSNSIRPSREVPLHISVQALDR